MFDFLYAQVRDFGCAWDAGTGNGQVAGRLAERFRKVYGTDISREQLQKAVRKDNITYLEERAERTSLPGRSVNLITAAQAVHWFDIKAFNEEVRRVAAPGALVAVWSYSWSHTVPEVDVVLAKGIRQIEKFWDPERMHIEHEYRTVEFPYLEIGTPEFHIEKNLTLIQYLGYINTWSGLKNFIAAKGYNPFEELYAEVSRAWGPEARIVKWPVFMRVGFVE